MGYHSQTILVKKDTFYYFIKMLKNMVQVDSGLLNSKIQLFPPLLLLAHLSEPPATPKKPSVPSTTPGSPHRRRVPLGGDNLQGILKKSLQLPPHRRPRPGEHDDDDEEEEEEENNEKENQPPDHPPPVPNGHEEGPLTQLLRKWKADIDLFRDTVYQDLEDFKRRLGIHFLSA
uniref:E4 n=1 Tax=Human papillomavirus TaxID=10566 RepID=M4JBV7_9PAPI|nr:E4 [Human papillomavirus]